MNFYLFTIFLARWWTTPAVYPCTHYNSVDKVDIVETQSVLQSRDLEYCFTQK